MRIKSVHLQDYKRFVDLTLTEIPETTRLVVLIGTERIREIVSIRRLFTKVMVSEHQPRHIA